MQTINTFSLELCRTFCPAREGHTYSSLLLWNIDQVSAHGGGKNDVSESLCFEQSRSSLGAIESTIEIHLHDLLPFFWLVILC